jgi:hypothetical protein
VSSPGISAAVPGLHLPLTFTRTFGSRIMLRTKSACGPCAAISQNVSPVPGGEVRSPLPTGVCRGLPDRRPVVSNNAKAFGPRPCRSDQPSRWLPTRSRTRSARYLVVRALGSRFVTKECSPTATRTSSGHGCQGQPASRATGWRRCGCARPAWRPPTLSSAMPHLVAEMQGPWQMSSARTDKVICWRGSLGTAFRSPGSPRWSGPWRGSTRAAPGWTQGQGVLVCVPRCRLP